MYASDLEALEAFQNNCLRRILRSSWMDYTTGVEVRRRCCGQPTMEEILRGRRLQWVGHMQRMGRERLPKAMLWREMDGGVRRQGRPTKTWWDGVKDDLKELGLVLHWRKLCQNREKWGKSIKPVKRKATKGELVAGRATKGELRSQGSRASGRLRERSGQSVPEATKESGGLEKATIEDLTERRRMTVGERKELPVSCAHCGRHFSQPRYMQRHKCVTTRKKG